MTLLNSLDEFLVLSSGRKRRLGKFHCNFCESIVVKTINNGRRDKSCGCLRDPGRNSSVWKGHVSKHPLFKVHRGILDRCSKTSYVSYHRYGGRGIKVCEEWKCNRAFIAWAESNGWKPGLTIDRLDNNGSYCPENCRWVSHQINGQNTINTRIDLDTARLIKQDLAKGYKGKEIAIRHQTTAAIVWRIRRGQSWKNA